MDKSLMDRRMSAMANERLYGTAALAFVEGADQMAGQKHTLQRNLLNERSEAWLKEHTQDGIISATTEEMTTFMGQRDAAYLLAGKSEQVWSDASRNFKQMVQDKVAFSATINAKEVDAQAAKESLEAAVSSMVKVLSGAAGAFGTMVPFLF